ncbi:hypothetical protein [Natrinema gelatinilyticum]|uniref:hypothetical protein n=1 Tax=Natrinema gelatinilyticum TaxID=2961571 RepID=UPI0020C1CBAE|nr:hypothetical protein [Natrinema gelatinilyticum]
MGDDESPHADDWRPTTGNGRRPVTGGETKRSETAQAAIVLERMGFSTDSYHPSPLRSADDST